MGLRHRAATTRVVAETYSPTRLLPHCFFFVQHNHTVGALSLVRLVLATLTRAFVPDALLDLANLAAPRRSGGLTASTSASTLPFLPRLPRLRRRPSSTTVLIASTSASPPPTTTASTRLRHYHGAPCVPAAPSTRNPTTTTSTSAIFSTTSSTTLLRPYARLPRHRHKGLPPCMRTHRLLLQPQHTRHIDCYDYGEMLVISFSSSLTVCSPL